MTSTLPIGTNFSDYIGLPPTTLKNVARYRVSAHAHAASAERTSEADRTMRRSLIRNRINGQRACIVGDDVSMTRTTTTALLLPSAMRRFTGLQPVE